MTRTYCPTCESMGHAHGCPEIPGEDHPEEEWPPLPEEGDPGPGAEERALVPLQPRSTDYFVRDT